MSRNLKFTVIVPTRERADVLGPALRTVVAQDYDNLEILVSDNFSSDDTRDVVGSFRDPRIRYLNTGQRLSMSHNWEFALSHVQNGWVTVLGDDDGLLPGALERVVELVDEYKVRLVGSGGGGYLWPSMTGMRHGKLFVRQRRGCERRSSGEWLGRLIGGRAHYTELPALYTGGFADYALVNEARDASGVFFRSMTPDVYSAVALTKVTDHYVYSHDPLALGGTSKHSTGTSQFSSPDAADEGPSPVKTFYAEGNIPFHEALSLREDGSPPRSLAMLAYECVLQSEHLAMPAGVDASFENALEVALRETKRRHRAEIEEWGLLFAQRHSLDFARIRRRATRLRYVDKVVKNVMKLAGRLGMTEISGSSQLPIKDVYEASLAAATVKALRRERPNGKI